MNDFELSEKDVWPLGFAKGEWISGRYQLESFLGEGGMGCVFQAFDRHLNRWVALKFMKHLSLESGRHLLREARLQALVEHDGICKVFEIGNDRGHTYLTMQCIQGEPLSAFTETISLEEKLALMRDVAQAIHAAHGQALIHRDLKPGNILVCETSSGTLKPYVMDFGLARRLEEANSTRTGAMRGTPLFMAPEQVRGDTKAIDRRTDVYGMGATLYFLLCGQPPHQGSNQAAVWVAILDQEAPSIRKLLPSVPKPVEVIVATALANAPNRRYGSAKALAQDLERYLAGESILAEPPTPWQRLRHVLYRHRWWFRTGLVSLVATLLVLSWGIYERKALAERARIANQFVQKTELVEALHRHYSMLPLHSVGEQQAYLLEQMNQIKKQMVDIGTMARGSGHYAVGRGLLSLKRYDQALIELRQARAVEPDNPAIALALGKVLGALYQRELARIETLSDLDQRNKARASAVREFRDPAQRLLQECHAHGALGEDGEQALAMLALFEGEDVQALQILAGVHQKKPWFYEALILQGQILTRLGDRYRDDDDFDFASSQYESAQLKLEEAVVIGRSDGEVYRALASLSFAKALFAKRKAPLETRSALMAGLNRCEQALAIDEHDADALWMTSIFKSMIAELEWQQGEDPSASWADALAYARQCLALEANRPLVYNSMGMVHQVMGRYVWSNGQDPDSHFQKAIDALRTGLQFHPNLPALHNNLGLAYLYQAQASPNGLSVESRGLRTAIHHLQTAIDHLPERVSTSLNLGAAYWLQAEAAFFAGENPTEALCEAGIAFDQVLARIPDHGIANYNKGNAVQMQGEFLLARGEASPTHFEEALIHFETAQKALPGVAEVDNAMAVAHLNLAKLAWQIGDDPFASLQEAMFAAHRALELRPDWDLVLFNLGLANWLDIKYHLATGVFDSHSLATGRALFEQVFQINSQFEDALVSLGDLALLEAQATQTDSIYSQAEQSYREALAINPENAFAHFGLGQLAMARARADHLTRAQCKVYLEEAQSFLEQACAYEKNRSEFLLNLGLVYLKRTRLDLGIGKASPALTTGIGFSQTLLKTKPTPLWAKWLEAEFRILAMSINDSPTQRAKAQKEATIAIREALSRNPSLGPQLQKESVLVRSEHDFSP